MGTVNYTIQRNVTGTAFTVIWASLSTSSGALDVGQAFPSSIDYAIGGMFFSDKSIHVATPFTQATSDTQLLIEGSNFVNVHTPTSGSMFASLTDAQGNALLFTPATSPRIEAILENTVYIRPRVTTTSAANMALDVFLTLTSNRNARSGM